MTEAHGAQFSLLKKWMTLQAALGDGELSSTAKVVLARLLDHLNSRTGQCNPSYETLATGTGRGRKAVIDAVKQLEECGWIFVERDTHQNAAAASKPLSSNHFKICFDRIKIEDVPSIENDTMASPESGTILVPKTTLASPEFDTSASPKKHPRASPENGTQNNEYRNHQIEIENLIPKNDPAGFEQFWAAYPSKVAKPQALKAFQRTAKAGVPMDEILAGLARYKNSKPSWQSWLHPATFLNNERWKDAPSSLTVSHKTQGTNSKPAVSHLERNIFVEDDF